MAPLVVAALAASAPLAASVADFTWDAKASSETVGTARDPGAVREQMRSLQASLAARQVDQGIAREVVVRLGADERKAIDTPSRSDGKYLVGVSRPLGIAVSFAGARGLGKRTATTTAGALRGTDDGGFVWTASFRSPGATALRLRFTDVQLPDGAALYVYNDAGQAFGPYTGRGPLGSGELWTNTVFGERIHVQVVSAVGGVPGLRIDSLGVMGKRFLVPRLGPQGAFEPGDIAALAASNLCADNASCVVNAACQSSTAVNKAKDAVASILFQSGGSFYICTGGLIADTDTASVIPYFLTAHHCIGKSSEAASLETYFDYQTTCSNPDCTQPYNNTGETVGATIMATGSTSDYSLVKLSSAPATPDGVATYLGWRTSAVANSNNFTLFRISHPQGSPQAYTEGVVDTSKGTCRSLPRGNFIYSRDTLGATEGGSSGSPVVDSNGDIVGQLYGACGTNLNDVCDAANNATVDGAFAASYPNLAAFLSPGGGGGGGCTLLPSGAACTTDGQCCSNSCKGKPNGKTCR